MKRIHTALAAAALVSVIAAPVQASPDIALGKKLYTEANCTKCHGAEKYTSKDRKVNSMATLKTFVQGCATNLSLSWFEDDVDSVAAYLNKEYYKFK